MRHTRAFAAALMSMSLDKGNTADEKRKKGGEPCGIGLNRVLGQDLIVK